MKTHYIQRYPNKVSFLMSCLLIFSSFQALAAETGKSSPITGSLSVVQGQEPILRAGKQQYRLISSDESIAAILRDPRMANRQVQLVGTVKRPGEFDVQRLYTVRDGKLYRVIYFCEVCNITSFKPGNCDCCQAPTELKEVPPDDPRVAVKETSRR